MRHWIAPGTFVGLSLIAGDLGLDAQAAVPKRSPRPLSGKRMHLARCALTQRLCFLKQLLGAKQGGRMLCCASGNVCAQDGHKTVWSYCR